MGLLEISRVTYKLCEIGGYIFLLCYFGHEGNLLFSKVPLDVVNHAHTFQRSFVAVRPDKYERAIQPLCQLLEPWQVKSAVIPGPFWRISLQNFADVNVANCLSS